MRYPDSPRPVRRGGVTPLAVLSLTLLVGVVAVVVDGGGLLEERRHVQAAADAAALAAASDLLAHYATNKGKDPSGTAAASAVATASANGFPNDGVNSVVTVSVSPQTYQDGPNKGKALPAGYAEVIVQYNAGRTFSNIFGSGSVPVRARAVARGAWGPAGGSVIALNLSATSTLSVTGNAGLTVNGSVQVNSSSPGAVGLTGNGGLTVSALNVNAAAGQLSLGLGLLGLGGSTPSVNYGGPVPDPLRALPAPNTAQLGLTVQATNAVYSSGTVDLYPGIYNGGITVNGTAQVVLHTNSDGSPGIYYLNGEGLKVSALASVTTASGETGGVMIYNAWQSSTDAVSITGQASLTLTPPASGTYQGISIFQARGTPSTPGPTVNLAGRGTLNVGGAVYAAHASVSVSGNGLGSVLGGQIIADTVTASGNGTVTVGSSGGSGSSTTSVNARTFGLVE